MMIMLSLLLLQSAGGSAEVRGVACSQQHTAHDPSNRRLRQVSDHSQASSQHSAAVSFLLALLMIQTTILSGYTLQEFEVLSRFVWLN